jgi:hypothetical protein
MFVRPIVFAVPFLSIVLSIVVVPSEAADAIWSLEAVNQLGEGTHPAIQSDVERVGLRGVALNSSTEYLPANAAWGPPIWQVYVQAIEGATGGIALFEGYFAGNQGNVLHALNVEAGDIVQATGFIANHNGKVNMNTRHGAVDLFEISIEEKSVGMPEPIDIPSIADCNFFDEGDTVPGEDQYRRTGGEKYQGQWCRLHGVWIESGTWGNNEEVILTDLSGEELVMLLSEMGDFDTAPAPQGKIDAIGLFDQEDTNTDGDFHDGYRFWVKRSTDITLSEPPAAVAGWELYR